jgi:3-methyl-2-oxobutanoate hydroxymethyltransferase
MADLPQLTITEGTEASVSGAMALMAEGRADFVKIEGGSEQISRIANAIAEAGIPVVGHFGMPSNYVDKPGVFRKWGTATKSERSDAQFLYELAERLQSAGCCALLLSKIRPDIASEISQSVDIPTIGIGSGPDCDGQILIFEELIGLTERDPPYYVKTYAQLGERAVEALQTYIQDVRTGSFPQDSHSHQD